MCCVSLARSCSYFHDRKSPKKFQCIDGEFSIDLVGGQDYGLRKVIKILRRGGGDSATRSSTWRYISRRYQR